METKRVLTRDNTYTDEITEMTTKVFKGVQLEYLEAYYMDFDVDEHTGLLNKGKRVKTYTRKQIDRNNKALKEAYHNAKSEL